VAAVVSQELSQLRKVFARFAGVAKGHPKLEAALPISADVSALAAIGLDAVAAIESGKAVKADWWAKAKALLDRQAAAEKASKGIVQVVTVRWARNRRRIRSVTVSHQGASAGPKSVSLLREEMFRCCSMSVAGIVFQACSFIRLRSHSSPESYGAMSRRSGFAAKADNHSDISPFKWSEQFTGGRRPAQPQTVT
jgi:hypothetical protein